MIASNYFSLQSFAFPVVQVLPSPGPSTLPLLHSPADVFRWLMVHLGLGSDPNTTGAWPVYNDSEPNSPDSCLTTYDTAPQSDGRMQTSGATVQHYGIQLRIRSTTANATWVKAEELKRYFDEQTYQEGVVVDGTPYCVHSVDNTDIIRVGKDKPNSLRSVCTMNPMITLERTA